MMNAKSFIRSLLMYSAVVFLSSCTREDFSSTRDSSEELTINYEVSGVDKMESPATRTVGSVRENQVNTIHTLFFHPTTEVFVGVTVSGATHNLTLGTGSMRAVMPTGTYVEDSHMLLFLANFPLYADIGSSSNPEEYLFNLLQGKTLSQAKDLIMAYSTDPNGLKSPFLMSFEFLKSANTNIANVKFQRSAVRVDLHNSDQNFVLVSAELRNARKETTAADVKYYNTGNAGDYVNYTGNKVTTVSNKIMGEFYTFENRVMTPSANDSHTTCLIIGGKHGGSSTVTYYRVNICAADAQQLLKRNNIYMINLTKVNSVGSLDENTAYNDPTIRIKYEINGWADNVNTTYIFDKDGNGLAVSQRYVAFGDKGGLDVEIEVMRLNSSTKPLATDWSIDPIDGTNAASFTAVKKVLDQNNKYITVRSLTDNPVSVERSASFNVVWGDIKVPVAITQLSTSTSESGIKAVPADLLFPKESKTLEVGIDLQGRFTGVTNADIKTAILYELGSGWITSVTYSRTDATTKIIYYKVTTSTIVSVGDFTRDADIKFSVIQGLTIMTCKAHVRQTTISVLPEQDFSQLRMTVERQKGGGDLFTAPEYIDMGAIGIAYTKEFSGFPADCPATEGNLQFAINDKAELRYNLGIISKMAWTIVQDTKVSQFVSFSKTSGAAGIGAETFVTITALKDAVADTQLVDGWEGWTGWDGTFKVVFENGTEKQYTIHQKGVIKRYVNPVNGTNSDSYRLYYYKAFKMYSKMWLDRNIGVTTSDFDLDTDARKGAGNTVGPDFTLAEANLNGGLCPVGFHIPTNEEWTPLQKNYLQSTTSVLSGSYTYYPGLVKYSDDPILYWQVPATYYFIASGSGYGNSTFFLTSTASNSYFIAGAYQYLTDIAYSSYFYNYGTTYYTTYYIMKSGLRQQISSAYVGNMPATGYYSQQTGSAGYNNTSAVTSYAAGSEYWLPIFYGTGNSNQLVARTQNGGLGRGVVRCVED